RVCQRRSGSNIDRCTETSLRGAPVSSRLARKDQAVNRGLADRAPRHLYQPGFGSNQGDTNRCTIPRRFRPCRKDRNRLAEMISPARFQRSHLRPHLSQEIFPATYSPSIFPQGEAHHPTRTFFLTNLLAQQIQTPLRSANVCPPILRMRPRLGKQCARQDI